MSSDEEVFDKLYRFHQLICGKFGREQPVTRDDILTISGFSPFIYKKCYNSAIQAIRLKCPRISEHQGTVGYKIVKFATDEWGEKRE